MSDDVADWLATATGYRPRDLARFELALTHASKSEANYQRLEFLGDRVLGLVIASWLYELFPDEPEGQLSRRLNVLVSRAMCAEIAREIGVPERMRLGKQAREDGASNSDNVVGDVVEALIGALLIDGGIEVADAFIRRAWEPHLDGQGNAPVHPKSALQELAAARGFKTPVYEVAGRTGAQHSPRFTVRVSVGAAGEASAEGSSKQEAETAAAEALLEQLK